MEINAIVEILMEITKKPLLIKKKNVIKNVQLKKMTQVKN
jgi:hypothetical protein